MFKKFRSFETLIIFGLYFLPILLWSVFGFSRMNLASHWTLFSLGLSIACFGGIAIWLLTSRDQTSLPIQPPVDFPPPIIPAPLPPSIVEVIQSIPPPPAPVDDSHKIEKEMLKEQIESLKAAQLDEREEKAGEIYSLKSDLEDKAKEIAAKNERIRELELKIEELDYEIKALIDFNHESTVEDSFSVNEQEAAKILRKWIDAAGNLTPFPGGHPLHGGSPYQSLTKLIQDEAQALVFVYDQIQEKIVGANSHTYTLFGLTPEQFAVKFHTLVPKDSLEWHEVKSNIDQAKWAGIKLENYHATLAPIQSGPLQGNFLGIAY